MCKFFLTVLFLIPFISVSYADELFEHTGILDLKLTNIPTFENYAVSVTDNIKIAEDVDFDSYEGAWKFRTRLREGLKNGPNFADKYVVVTHGCGTSCQVNWVLNSETGKVLGKFSSTYGAHYRRDSRLIIGNQPNYSEVEPEYYYLMHAIDYYKVWKDELRLIKRIDIRGMHSDVSEINAEMRKKRSGVTE